jgi:SAM-dependent methyltransferase
VNCGLSTADCGLASTRVRRAPPLLYAAVIFLSAFLLFLVQPIIAKLILPWFGGSAAVWITCLLFFQVALLAGYLYAHYLVGRLPAKLQSPVHLTMLGASLLALPILPHESWKPSAPEHPAWDILLLLAATIGLPYLALSSTSPLLQAWYAQSSDGLERQPYRLFALSNAGSMLALVGYPTLVEPFFLRRHQAIGWSMAYAGVCLLCALAALRRPRYVATPTCPPLVPPPGWSVQWLWVALAACASALLLSTTNHLTQNLAAIPFLWLLPLALYLLSFILCFEGRSWYRRGLFLRLLAVALGSMAYALAPEFDNTKLAVLIPLYAIGLFICCMFCHGELAGLKPHPARLTSFYLMISLGGATGGLFVALVAPHVFPGYFELPIALAFCGVLALIVLHRTPGTAFYKARWHPAWLLVVALTLALIVSLAKTTWKRVSEAEAMVRNFYGCLRVIDYELPPVELVQAGKEEALGEDWRCRKLMNGTIDHGLQLQASNRRRQPTGYYGADSGIGRTLRALGAHGPLRVGIIGLGAGTIAAFGRRGDRYTFYEINPLDIQLANTRFTFVRDSRAEVEIVAGDARLSLEHEPSQQFDVLALDAFSSDAIPIHLLTREAMALYFRQLKPDGVLAANISNKYLNLQPVFSSAAEWFGRRAAVIDTQGEEEKRVYRAVWVLVSNREDFFGTVEIREVAERPEKRPGLRPWTDDYSNLLAVLK